MTSTERPSRPGAVAVVWAWLKRFINALQETEVDRLQREVAALEAAAVEDDQGDKTPPAVP